MVAKLTLAVALTLVQEPDAFLAAYHAVKDGALPQHDWLKRNGGKVYLKRRGCLVQLTQYDYIFNQRRS